MESIVSSGITPLEVLLTTMREHWEKGEKALACAVAKDAAPYIHARLLSSESKNETTVTYVAELPPVAADTDTWLKQLPPNVPLHS